ncbi:MotA/TolQ/ExbB proton channel family protein [Candidatus Uabimicrobium sp. HlEnr_7]|uniref:MotA/TolQ/ExbB proton channel family protein n=1 Tax=Candidatus Uabimicrobium helgolandensis TaxID=3095367 RepID=UPI0035580DFA
MLSEYLESQAFQQSIEFFQNRLTLLDFIIIGLGCFILLYQTWKRFTTFSNSFYKKAQNDPLFITREQLKIRYISSLIEMLPMMGIMGTVWGLMGALYVISSQDMPTVKDIATHIAPALSTTLFGLFFAVLNLFMFNFLSTYYLELIAWCQTNNPKLVSLKEGTDEEA